MTIGELIKDVYFIKLVDDHISKLHKDRRLRPTPRPGYFYKRNWYDRMFENNELNTEFFLEKIPYIWRKTSYLPSETRNIISLVCDKAKDDTLIYYESLKK